MLKARPSLRKIEGKVQLEMWDFERERKADEEQTELSALGQSSDGVFAHSLRGKMKIW